MSLTSIKIELAAEGRETSDHANDILSYFRSVGNTGYLFNTDSHPATIVVGYAGGAAVAAATCYEDVMKANHVSYETEAEFIGKPSLGVYLIATEWSHRRNGYATQLVGSIFNLAAGHGFDRVEAIGVTGDSAMMFWGSCGFQPVPYEDYDYKRYKSTERGVDYTAFEAIVSPDVNKRLSEFVQAQASFK